MHMNQKVHSITSCLIPISWLQHHICQSYDRSKIMGTPKNTKFWTPIFPKIWVREQKNLVWLHVSPRGTCTPKMSKIGDKKFFDDRFLLWFQPECPHWIWKQLWSQLKGVLSVLISWKIRCFFLAKQRYACSLNCLLACLLVCLLARLLIHN